MRPIRKILFITLSNIGDCILTMPALDALKNRYPDAAITVFCGPRPAGLFEHDQTIRSTVVYDKRASLRDKARLVLSLITQKFDLVVDMRNSLLGLLLPAGMRFWGASRRLGASAHMRDRHYSVIERPGIPGGTAVPRLSLAVTAADRKTADGLLAQSGVTAAQRFVVVSAGARSAIKRWPRERYAELLRRIIREFGVRVVLLGDRDDAAVNGYLAAQCGSAVVDATGRTTFACAAALLERARLLITNDSANLHLASYLNVPVIGIFGPTDDAKYGPWSRQSATVKKEIFCRPCCKAQCRFNTLACMQLVSVEDVLLPVRRFLSGDMAGCGRQEAPQARYKRILVTRTDRIGDVVLSTPVLKALRMAYPCAYLAMLVRPYTRAVVEGNPYLDEIIVYDKKECDGNFFKFFGFIRRLAGRKFDAALVLHPTNRDHLIVFLSGIKRRIGYGRKLGFLMTDRLVHDKQLGQKHESEYALDMARCLGIEPREKEFFVPADSRAEQWAGDFLRAAGVKAGERVVAINPGASCPSKIWPPVRYAAVADALAARGYKIVVLAGPDSLDKKTAQSVIGNMRAPAVDCIDKAPIPETASLFRRSSLVISADTGPMHIAAAVGVPVIAIFGRNQAGISPQRWGPANKNSIVLHKDVGCTKCLAHGCAMGFACLAAVTVEEVLVAADRLIQRKKV